MRAFEPASIGPVKLANRIIRSATFEGLADGDGTPGAAYVELYSSLATQGIGGLITGFAYVSRDGRAMQPGQAGLDSDDKIALFARVADSVHRQGGRIFLQLAHAGRQTVSAATGGPVFGPSTRKSPYFNARPTPLTGGQTEEVTRRFAAAAHRAEEAGFDGVQLHAAHGYLIHQFLHPAVNDRRDEFGICARTGLGTAFLERIIDRIRSACGSAYPVLVKVSAGDTVFRAFTQKRFVELTRFLDAKRVDAIEVSFGTMDHALNIFRGASVPADLILHYNPRHGVRSALGRLAWKAVVLPFLRLRLKPLTPMYNLDAARLAKQHTTVPVICVGGFRSGEHIRCAIEDHGIDFVSLCRPLLCEPDFVRQVQADSRYESRCRNCNRCAVMCDSGFPTRCLAHRAPGGVPRAESDRAPSTPLGAIADVGPPTKEEAYES